MTQPPRRGRRRESLPVPLRCELRILRELYPRWGLPRLRAAIPTLPRNSAAAYLRRLDRLERRRRRRRCNRVIWNVPGAVWAIDGTWLDRPAPPLARRALLVAELHSRQTLCLRPVTGECVAEAERVLLELFDQHGTPLVLKLDNGSGFIAARLGAVCCERGVTLLHSPPRQPRWNGTCEVSVRWAKRRVETAWLARGGQGGYVAADLEAATTFVGPMARVDEGLRERFRGIVDEQLAIAAAERGLVIGDVSEDHVRRSLGRVAVRRALQTCHILSIEGRRYRQWFPPSVA